jgi:hypothetical protein
MTHKITEGVIGPEIRSGAYYVLTSALGSQDNADQLIDVIGAG